ncbi:PAS domain S-box protein [Flavobacterium sp. MFBS3-15]|uniref:PAS domain S-box protein n=1 Tax=Flavobacterium sp. MFBS3-15 TaxID=2989816 RepID=UPI002235B2F1|nr:PAS domain S-box protein [Flavobacterium sp. MFBS3-15]MCW4470817.1 PAS domain S-box protein [Flavobacterium sp. MFBS3-15]
MDTINFSTGLLDEIFPFYVLFDDQMNILSYGKSIKKVFPGLKKGNFIGNYFNARRPNIERFDSMSVTESLNQLIILECLDVNPLLMRGQFLAVKECFLFVGSPWLTSVEDVTKNNLSILDFASHDTQLDLLQILKLQQTKNEQLKNLLEINNRQKEELKKDKEELNRLSLVASDNKNAIVFTDAEAKIFWCNEAYHEITGFSKQDIMGKTPIEIGRAPNTDKETLDTMVDLFFKGKPFDIEISHARKDGTYFWSRTKGQPLYNSAGEFMQYFAVIEDMTEEKEREEQLVLLSLIAEKNINAVVICDNEGRIEWVNSSFLSISGYEINELIGKKPGSLLQGPESNSDSINYLSNQIKKGEPFSCELINYSKKGRKYWVKIQGQALFNKWGEVSRYFAIEEDVTEKKELEKQREELLASLEKSNNELEEYAQVVSHDLKSPLRSINSLIFWIKEDDAQLNSKSLEYLRLIEGKVEKMDHLIQGILMYSKIDNAALDVKEPVDTYKVVCNISDTIHVPSHITLNISENLPVIMADNYRIHQLFQNLMGNAVNYIDKPNGQISIDVEEQADYYIFSVMDNGPGIAPENHEKIFKTFQSLVKNDQSTGLGLSIVKKIVNYYKGKIWLESKLGEGTTFYVQLNK